MDIIYCIMILIAFMEEFTYIKVMTESTVFNPIIDVLFFTLMIFCFSFSDLFFFFRFLNLNKEINNRNAVIKTIMLSLIISISASVVFLVV